MPRCPYCKRLINSLVYVTSETVTATFVLSYEDNKVSYDYNNWQSHGDLEWGEYECPLCYAVICADQADAIKFLSSIEYPNSKDEVKL
jgi:hypothetical protein